MGGQEELTPVRGVPFNREPVEIVLPCKSRVKKWAFENAYMLALVFGLFVATWIGLFIVGVKAYVGN